MSDKATREPYQDAMNFMLLALKEYEPMTHGGLNQIPYKCFESVAKVMTDFSLVQKEALESENKLLQEALQGIVNQIEYDHLDEYMDTQYNKAKAALKGESLEK